MMKASQISLLLAGALLLAMPLVAGGQKSGTATSATGKPLKPAASQSTDKTAKQEATATGEKAPATLSKEKTTSHKTTSAKSAKNGKEVKKEEAPMKAVSKSD